MSSYVEDGFRGLRIKVLSYNIHSCFGVDRKYDPERVLRVLNAAAADVIALQEVDSSLDVRDGIDQLRYFAEGTRMHSVMGPTLRKGYGAYGNAFLSRAPFVGVTERDLTYRRFEPRGLLEALIRADPVPIRLVNTHLGLKAWERRFQLDHLLESVDWGENRPTLVMGDFNEWFPWSRNARKLARRFGPTPRVRTFPSRWPRFPLDRVYAHPRPRRFNLRALDAPEAWVASDHLPVLAELEF